MRARRFRRALDNSVRLPAAAFINAFGAFTHIDGTGPTRQKYFEGRCTVWTGKNYWRRRWCWPRWLLRAAARRARLRAPAGAHLPARFRARAVARRAARQAPAPEARRAQARSANDPALRPARARARPLERQGGARGRAGSPPDGGGGSGFRKGFPPPPACVDVYGLKRAPFSK